MDRTPDRLLNAGREIEELTLNNTERVDENTEEEPIPTKLEVKKAINKLKNNKAPGVDGIRAEDLKEG